MIEKKKDSSMEVSRRSVLLQGAFCATGIATVLATNIEAAKAAQLPQASVAYRGPGQPDWQIFAGFNMQFLN